MQTILTSAATRASWLVLLGLLSSAVCLHAQSTSNGSVEGRVLNATNGSYLPNVRVTVDGTRLEVFTDEYGRYLLPDVSAGHAALTFFYTGLAPQNVSVQVEAGKTSDKNVSLDTATGTRPENEVLKLDQFVVAGKKDPNDAAIAINEQRFAGNIKNVLGADAFGDITEGNPGDFLKFIPGVTVNYVGPNPDDIMIAASVRTTLP